MRLQQLKFTSFIVCSLSLFFTGCSFAQAPAQSTPAPKHSVFAHYMLAYGSSVEFYKQEIELAQRAGIDGFALNAGEWLRDDGQPTGYVGSGERMYQAARELNTDFKLFFSPDLNGLPNLPVNIGDMVARYKDHPNQLRRDGKVVLSGWGGTPSSYTHSVNKIKESGTPIFFVPFVYNPRYTINWSAQTVRNFYQDQPHMDGLFFFGADGIFPEIIRTNSIGTRVSHEQGKLFMAGISPAFNSPNLRDFHGMKGYGEMWKGVIRDGADWVELVTWNDYNEDSNLMPFRWPAGAEKNHISRDESFLDLTAYYSAWYKTGVQPAITQDKLYYSYRNRSKNLTKAWNPIKKEWFDITRGVRVDQIHDDVQDNVYVTTFLTAPAELTVTLGAAKKTFAMPAGIGHATITMQPGVPRFQLNRKNGDAVKSLIDVFGRKLIITKETEENSLDGYHLSNRTWGGGSAVGPITRLEAENGTLNAGATLKKDGKVSAVQNLEQDDSGVSIPVQNLKSGTYNVRLIYSNPNPTEARLTLSADGAPRGEKELPAFIPAFLPPTGAGKYATTSFFWSLSAQTTFLKLAWVLGREYGLGQPWPAHDDIGSVLIDAIELIPVAPVVAPAAAPVKAVSVPMADNFAVGSRNKGPENFNTSTPELVSIPGGTFQMGSKDGAPDETPMHSVTLAPFAIGKTEITNKQFEEFDPTHKAFRDEFSNRDSDPVIYVSWNDAAKYCNWLSAQQNLTPVYDEKTWNADLKANGYRLPSEAEWEYVASGRGENRKYPWGDETPDETRGNFLLQPPGSAGLPIDFIGYGTTAAGSYPAGASRDGVLDMGGNVAEWCADYYAPYSDAPQTDPLNQTASNYRAIRGNSWGYYGRSPRSADREFNSPGYPGYIYIGFRVASSGRR